MIEQHDADKLRKGYLELGLGDVENVDSWIRTEVAGGGRYLTACILAVSLREGICREWTEMRERLERAGVALSGEAGSALDKGLLGVLCSVARVLSMPEKYIPESVEDVVKGWVLLEEVEDDSVADAGDDGRRLPPIDEVMEDCTPGGWAALDPEVGILRNRFLDGVQRLIDETKRKGAQGPG
jgi:hypothetical protein